MNRSTNTFTKERNTTTVLKIATGTGWDGPNVTTDGFAEGNALYGSAYGSGFFAAIRHFEKLKP